MSERQSYNAFPYPSFTFAQTHPDRLATMGSFHGVDAADPRKCRVLELGCGTGANVAAMAYSLPSSEFVGIDISEAHIEQAEQMRLTVGLRNATFLRQDVMDLDPDAFGKFDYIVAHGLFSWVPEFVRERTLEIYSKCLADNGVGYISYNAYPGCHIREIARGMMRFHVADVTDPLSKVESGLEFLGALVDALEPSDIYQPMIRLELEGMIERSAANVRHDDLAEINQPFYFHEFAIRLKESGLQYIAESTASSTNPQRLTKAGQELVQRFADGDVIKSEQYADFLKGTRFRSTLFCRSNIDLVRNPSPAIIRDFYIATNLEETSSSQAAESGQSQRFTGAHGATFELNHPLTIEALRYLSTLAPWSVTLEELLEAIATDVPADTTDVDRSMAYLSQLFQAGFVTLHKFRPTLPTGISDRPEISPLARWQYSIGSESVTTLYGTSRAVDDNLLQELIVLLDGTKDRDEIGEALNERLEIPDEKRSEFQRDLPAILESALTRLHRIGLLVA